MRTPGLGKTGRMWTSAPTPARLLKETEAGGQPGTPPSRRRRHLCPLGLRPAARPPHARGGPGLVAGGSPRAALTWLAAWSAGRQQGAAQTQRRRREQQPSQPHCPRPGAHRAARSGDGPACGRLELRALPAPARSSRGRCGRPAERSPRVRSGGSASPAAHSAGRSVAKRARGAEGRGRAPRCARGKGAPRRRVCASTRSSGPASPGSLPSCRAAPGAGRPRALGRLPRSPRSRPAAPSRAFPALPAPGCRPLPDGGNQTRHCFLWEPLTRARSVTQSGGGLGSGPRGLGGCLWVSPDPPGSRAACTPPTPTPQVRNAPQGAAPEPRAERASGPAGKFAISLKICK